MGFPWGFHGFFTSVSKFTQGYLAPELSHTDLAARLGHAVVQVLLEGGCFQSKNGIRLGTSWGEVIYMGSSNWNNDHDNLE